MNIIVCNNFVRQGSGIDAFVRLEVDALRKRGHSVRVFGADNAALDRLRGINKARTLASTVYSLPARRSLQRLLTAHRYDLAYVHNTVPLLTGSIYDALHDQHVLTLQHLHNYRAFCLDSYAYRAGRSCNLCARTAFTSGTVLRCYRDSLIASAGLTAARLIDCSRRRSSGYDAQAYIANSAFTKRQHLRHGLREDRVWLLPNPSEDVAALLDSRVSTSVSSHKILTFVGSLLRAKGVYEVLDLAEALPDFEVRLVGSGPEESGLRRQIQMRRLRNVSLTGLLVGSEKARVWSDSFVTLAPSMWDEPFGLVVPESYSLSIPVVTTGAGGLAETIHDGQTGFIQTFRDPSTTAALLRSLWRDEERYARMRHAARRFYDMEFTEQVFTKRLSLLQAEILDHYRPLTGP